jgi:hypothetical protein
MHSVERFWRVPRPNRSQSTRRLRGWGRSRARLVLVVLAIAWLASTGRGKDVDRHAATPEAALAGALAARGLACGASDVVWIDRSRGFSFTGAGRARALVRASLAGEPSDLYAVEARLSPEGAVLDVGSAWNVTGTTGVDESVPSLRGQVAVYITSADDLVRGVHVLNLAGRSPDSYADFTRVQRAQIALTNLQQTGRTTGVVRDTFALDPVARHVVTAWREDGAIEVRADDHVVVIDPARARVVSGESFVRVVADERARPGNLVTWGVDRLRAVSWIGDEKMQWVKAIAFTALDKVRAPFAGPTTADDVRDELGLPSDPSPGPLAFADPDVGWPPRAIKPVISTPLPGEGQWIALEHDAFITPPTSGTPPAIVTSFIRPSPHRQDARVYVTLWDARQIALHMEAGTVEPISATGEHGPGMIPRNPGVLSHVVAAFNGGFQAQHGEYGMQANGIEYLPPKPYAATVAELRDGSIGFGAWPAAGDAPGDFVALRQNLTALVQGGKYNPWGRVWWGGTPPGWPDQIHSARSALCLTTEGFVGYFYSTSISAEDLALGMLATRCSFGIHLDMNPGHAGFEFYDVAREGQLAPLGRPLQSDWEAEGKVSGQPGYVFRSRRMIRGMGHMLFPRYIQREARDFFYLTSRPLLPGLPVASAGAAAGSEEGVWRTKGLPQHGFPYALATTSVSLDSRSRGPVRMRLLRADPRTMSPAIGASSDAPTVLALAAPMKGSLTLAWTGDAFAIAPSTTGNESAVLARGYPASEAPGATARAAVGVQRDDGMLAWVELAPEVHPDASTAAAMDALLEKLGCPDRMTLPGDARALLGGSLDVAGDPLSPLPPISARLVRAHAPDAHPIFADTPIVPPQIWQPLQAKRVRYFYKPPPSPSAAPGAPDKAEDAL